MAVCLPGRRTGNTPQVHLREARECSVAIIGPRGVGKSNFAAVFFGHNFDPLLEPSNVEFTLRSEMYVGDDPFIVLVVDCPPDDYYAASQRCAGVIVMYDVSSRKTFEALGEILDSIMGTTEESDGGGRRGGEVNSNSGSNRNNNRNNNNLFEIDDTLDSDNDEQEEEDFNGGSNSNSNSNKAYTQGDENPGGYYANDDEDGHDTEFMRRARERGNNVKKGEPPAVVLICGHKSDVDDSKRQVSTDEGREFADKRGAMFLEASAKIRFNVEEGVYDVVQAVFEAGRAPRVEVTDEVPANMRFRKDPKCVVM